MRVTVTILGVDGSSHEETKTDNSIDALDFLRLHDHEGSSISVNMLFEAEECYAVLETAAGYEVAARAHIARMKRKESSS